MISEDKSVTTIPELAALVAGGFNDMAEKFNKVDERLGKLESGQEDTKSRLIVLESAAEDIQLRLGNVVYRFEHKELVKRVNRLETHSGINK